MGPMLSTLKRLCPLCSRLVGRTPDLSLRMEEEDFSVTGRRRDSDWMLNFWCILYVLIRVNLGSFREDSICEGFRDFSSGLPDRSACLLGFVDFFRPASLNLISFTSARHSTGLVAQ